MPRSNRPHRPDRANRSGRGARAGRGGEAPDLDIARALGGAPRREAGARGDEWFVRPVAGPSATKSYLCPGCSQSIPPGTAHVVAWPAEGPAAAIHGAELRRHWHSPCWRARERRR